MSIFRRRARYVVLGVSFVERDPEGLQHDEGALAGSGLLLRR